MTSKNIANYTTFNSILVNYIEIQNNETGLVIYATDPTNPSFSFNPATEEFNMTGLLNVTGSASFETITVSQFEGGMQSLAVNNPADLMDLGINANYNDGISKYTGIIRDTSDSFKRWTFFKDIETIPATTVEGIDYTKLDSVRMNKLYVNDGTVTTPSITFHNDTACDTGFYLVGQNHIGVTAGGVKLMAIEYVGPTAANVQLDSTVTFSLKKINTVDDAASASPGITTGHIYMQSTSAADKWCKFYSATTAGIPAYSGAVLTSATTNYFLLNTGTNMEIVKNTVVTSESSAPDYRDATSAQILVIGSSSVESKSKILIPLGTAAAPSLSFGTNTDLGLYRVNSNVMGVAVGGANVTSFAATGITFAQPVKLSNGAVGAPSLTFSAVATTGIWRDSTALYENVAFSASGTSLGYFWLNGTAQWITGSVGSASVPSIAWSNDIQTGLFAPTAEAATGQLSVACTGTEIARFRPRSGTGNGNIDLYNSAAIKPGGSATTALFNASATNILNTLKAREAWFQAYNIGDTSTVFLYLFRSQGSVAKDYSGNSYDAVAVGTPTIEGTTLDTNGVVKHDVLDLRLNTTKYLNLTTRIAALSALDNTTISFWFKCSGVLTESNTIFSCAKTGKALTIQILADAAAYPNALQVTIESDALTTLQYHTATSADPGTPSPISINDGLWHHIAIHLGSAVGSVNPKKFMFLDSVELDTATNTIYVTSTGDNAGNPKLSTNSFNDLAFTASSIGAYFLSSASLFYTGYLKDFYITGRLLSAAEITQLYTEPYLYTYGIDAAVAKIGQLVPSGQLLAADGTAAAPSISFSNSPTSGLFRTGTSHNIGVVTNGVKRIDVSDAETNIANGLRLSAGLRQFVGTVTGTSATLDSTYHIVICSYAADASNVVLTLPSASANTGREYLVIKTGDGGGSVVINRAGSDLIDDDSTTSITLNTKYDRVTLIGGTSTHWFTV